tara:strand:+ start:635 stop:802 length:168 start_codon:yes stop_codon:yes gene_type:complete
MVGMLVKFKTARIGIPVGTVGLVIDRSTEHSWVVKIAGRDGKTVRSWTRDLEIIK